LSTENIKSQDFDLTIIKSRAKKISNKQLAMANELVNYVKKEIRK